MSQVRRLQIKSERPVRVPLTLTVWQLQMRQTVTSEKVRLVNLARQVRQTVTSEKVRLVNLARQVRQTVTSEKVRLVNLASKCRPAEYRTCTRLRGGPPAPRTAHCS